MSRLATIAVGAAVATLAVTSALAAPADAASQASLHSERVCGKASAGYASCMALVRTDAKGRPLATSGPTGYGPSDLLSAYNLPATGGTGKTVAIVDAYDDPTAESDLGVYRSQYKFPACTTANGCFRKVNQSGGTVYPRA